MKKWGQMSGYKRIKVVALFVILGALAGGVFAKKSKDLAKYDAGELGIFESSVMWNAVSLEPEKACYVSEDGSMQVCLMRVEKDGLLETSLRNLEAKGDFGGTVRHISKKQRKKNNVKDGYFTMDTVARDRYINERIWKKLVNEDSFGKLKEENREIRTAYVETSKKEEVKKKENVNTDTLKSIEQLKIRLMGEQPSGKGAEYWIMANYEAKNGKRYIFVGRSVAEKSRSLIITEIQRTWSLPE